MTVEPSASRTSASTVCSPGWSTHQIKWALGERAEDLPSMRYVTDCVPVGTATVRRMRCCRAAGAASGGRRYGRARHTCGTCSPSTIRAPTGGCGMPAHAQSRASGGRTSTHALAVVERRRVVGQQAGAGVDGESAECVLLVGTVPSVHSSVLGQAGVGSRPERGYLGAHEAIGAGTQGGLPAGRAA